MKKKRLAYYTFTTKRNMVTFLKAIVTIAYLKYATHVTLPFKPDTLLSLGL